MEATLTHIALHVHDLEACIAFYERYCGMRIAQERTDSRGRRVVWMAEPGRSRQFIFVLLPGGSGREQPAGD